MPQAPRGFVSILLLTFWFLPCAGAARGQGAASPATLQVISQASALSHKGDDEGAANLCRNALHQSPNEPALYDCIGRAFTNKGSYQEAAAAYEQEVPLLVMQPYAKFNLAGAYASLAVLYLELNRLDEAQDRADKALKVRPDFAQAIITKGVILETRGQLDSAIEQYRNALALAPRSAAASQNLGSALQKKGQIQEAVSALQVGVQTNPRDPDLRAAYGSALLAAGRPADAEKEFQTSLSSRPENSSFLYNLADAQRKQGKTSEALANLRKAYELTPGDPEINLGLGSPLVETG